MSKNWEGVIVKTSKIEDDGYMSITFDIVDKDTTHGVFGGIEVRGMANEILKKAQEKASKLLTQVELAEDIVAGKRFNIPGSVEPAPTLPVPFDPEPEPEPEPPEPEWTPPKPPKKKRTKKTTWEPEPVFGPVVEDVSDLFGYPSFATQEDE